MTSFITIFFHSLFTAHCHIIKLILGIYFWEYYVYHYPTRHHKIQYLKVAIVYFCLFVCELA